MKEKEATINRSDDSTIRRSDGAMIVALWCGRGFGVKDDGGTEVKGRGMA